jgi:hypothetical protein
MSDSGESLPVLALVSDLIFSSKISAEARAAGALLKIIRQPSALADQPGSNLLVDLNLPGGIEAAAAWGKATGNPVIGFVSHEDRAAIDAARAAGIGRVMARSQFVQAIAGLLAAQ